MSRLALLAVLLLVLLSATLRAERYELNAYGATVDIPSGEGWFRRGGPQLRTGEFPAFAMNSTTKAIFGVAAIPGYPTNDVRHATVISRLSELMRNLGHEPARQRFGIQDDQDYVELIGSQTADSGDKFVMVARGLLKNGNLFITLQSAKGTDEDADRPEFMAHIETLNFNRKLEYATLDIATKLPQLIPWHYRAYRAAAVAAGGLTLAFAVMIFVTRKRHSH